MISNKCIIFEKRGQSQKERHEQTEGLKAVHAQEKEELLYRVSVFEGDTETIGKLSKKGNRDIHHSNREGARNLEEGLTVKNNRN